MLVDKLADKLFDSGLIEYDEQGVEEDNEDDELDEDDLAHVLGLRGGAAADDENDLLDEADDDYDLDEDGLANVLGMHGGAAMKAMKELKAATYKRKVFAGKMTKTLTGLTKGDLVKNKRGKVVSKKQMLRGQKNPWIVAVNKARAALKVKGLGIVKKGSPLYAKAKEFYKR